MKKITLWSLITLFVTLIVAGCGSNTRADPIYVSPYEFTNASTPLKIVDPDSDYNITVQLIENGFGFADQSVKMLPFNADFGTLISASVVTDADGWAAFTYHSPDDILELRGQSVTLQAAYINDENVTELTQDFVLNFLDESTDDEYKLTNQTTPILVDGNGSSQPISVYMVDADNIGVEGQTVTTTILDQAFGSISPSSAETDASGKAIFTYVGPTDITHMIGQSTSVTLTYRTQTVRVEIQIIAPRF